MTITNEDVLINAGITPEAFLGLGQNTNDRIYQDYWEGIIRDMSALTEDEITSRFGDTHTLQSVLTIIFKARQEAEQLRVEDATNNKYAARFDTLRQGKNTRISREIASGETAMSIGFIDISDSGDNSLSGQLVPTSIVVEEIFLNQKLDTVRSNTSPVVPGYKSSHRITLDIVFSNIDAINNEQNGLRALYAQAKMLPFLTVESPLLSAIYINKVVTPRIYEAINRSVTEQAAAQEEMDDITSSAVTSFENAIELIKSQDPFLSIALDDIHREIAEKTFRTTQPTSPNVSDVDGAVSAIMDNISFAIPVAFAGVTTQTMPGKPGALLTRWSFVRMSNGSFKNGEMMFRDEIGNPTFDIRDCVYARKYFRKLLDKNQGSNKFLEEIKTDENGTPIRFGSADFIWSDVLGNERFLDIPKMIDQQITVRMKNKTVELPISGNFFPAIQYMGANNTECHVVYATKDLEVIQQFSRMKFELLSEGRKGLLRRGSVTYNHPLLAALGLRDFAINAVSIESASDYPDLYHITVHLIESVVDLRDTETLSLSTSGLSPKTFKLFMKYLYGVYINGYQSMLDGTMDRIPIQERKSIEMCYKFIFGSKLNGIGGILSPIGRKYETMVAAIFKAMHASSTGSHTSFTSDASKDYPPLYAFNERGTRDGVRIKHDRLSKLEYKVLTGEEDSLIKKTRESYSYGYMGYGGGGTRIQESYARTVRELAEILTDFYIPGRSNNSGPMPENVWDAITLILMRHRDDDDSDQEFWTDRHIQTSYLIILSSLSTDSVDLFSDVSDPDNNNPKAVFPRSQIISTKQLETSTRPDANISTIDSCYPDLDLPTYQDLFTELDTHGIPQLIVDSQNIPVWTRFAPTYDELGFPPPFTEGNAFRNASEGSSQVAKNLNDQVEPSVFYYRRHIKRDRIRPFTSQSMKKADTGSDQLGTNETIITVPYGIRDVVGRDIGSWIKDQVAIGERSPDDKLNDARRRFIKTTKNATKQKTIHYVTSEGMPFAVLVHRPGEPATIVETIGSRPTYRTSSSLEFDPQSSEHSAQITQSSLDHMEDNSKSMSRCFPTIKIYLIEEDREVLIFSDDFYGYSSVVDCNITTDKNDAAVATIRLSNYSGVFSEDEFADQKILEDRHDIIDDEGEPFLSKFKLKAGTHIQIRMGYSTSKQLLPITFTGQVAEVQPGDIVTIICQDFKTELFNDVGFFQEKYSLTNVDRPNNRAVINKILKMVGDTPHLGRSYEYDGKAAKDPDFKQTMIDIYGHQYSSGLFATGLGGQTGMWHELFGGSYSDITRNVWYDTPGYLKSEWITTNKPGWDALQEVVRYVPNYICQVVPYDADATVFIGNPSQIYKYSAMTDSERRTYLKVAPYVKARTDNKAAQRNSKSEGLTSLIANFQNSKYYTGNARAQLLSDGVYASAGSMHNERIQSLLPYGHMMKMFPSAASTDPSVNDFLARDYSQAWEGIGRIDPSLQRFLFARFFGFRFSGIPYPGSMEGSWNSLMSMGMKKAVTKLQAEGFHAGMRELTDLIGISDKYEYTKEGNLVWNEWLTDGGNGVITGGTAEVEDTSVYSGPSRNEFNSDYRDVKAYRDIKRDLQERLVRVGTPLSDSRDLPSSTRSIQDVSDSLQNEIFQYEMLENKAKYGENPKTTIRQILHSGAADLIGKEVNIPISEHIRTHLPAFRLFINSFYNWIQSKEGTRQKKNLGVELNNFRVSGLPPGYKQFRDYHFIDSDEDIIQNNIVTGDSEMWNSVALRTIASVESMMASWAAFKAGLRGIIDPDDLDQIQLDPAQELVMYPRNSSGKPPGINFMGKPTSGDDILKVFLEPNSGESTMAAWCLAARMAQGLQKMYRGNLIIVGRNVKPWDVIMIRDDETEMYGPVVVERATHHFSVETGWVTTIVPSAHTNVNSLIDRNQMGVMNDIALFLASDTFNNLMWIITGVSVLAAIANPVGLTAAVVGGALARRTAASAFGMLSTGIQTTLKTNAIIKSVGQVALSTGKFASGVGTIGGAGVGAIGRAGLATSIGALPLGAGLGIYESYGSAFWDDELSFQLDNENMPVFIRTLQYKGRPFYAGLTPQEHDFKSFGQKAKDMYRDAVKAVSEFTTADVDPYNQSQRLLQDVRDQK